MVALYHGLANVKILLGTQVVGIAVEVHGIQLICAVLRFGFWCIVWRCKQNINQRFNIELYPLGEERFIIRLATTEGIKIISWNKDVYDNNYAL